MTALAFAGGVAEALFLVTTTRAAFAITDGQESVGIAAGRNLSVDRTLVLALVLVLVRIALAVLANWQSARLVSSVVADVRRDLSQAFLLSSWEAQQGERVGSLQELLTTFTGQASALITAVGLALVSAANLAALTGVAIAVDPLGAVVLVVTVGVLGSGLRPLRRGILRQGAATSATGMDFATTVSEVSNLGLELHVFHVQDAAQRRVSRVIELGRQTQRRLQLMSGLTTPIYVGLAYLALLGALALVAASGSASLTSLGASMLVMLRSLSYGQALQSSYASVSANAPAIDELKRRLAYFRGARRLDGGAALTSLGVVQVRGVSFAYADGHDVLHDVSFSISPGEVIGVVGPSGSGKSTLVQLLLGLRDAQQGTITADGRDIASFDRDLWARKVTFVPQAPRLIAGTIADNIRFLRDDVTDEEVEAAARLAHLHEDIVALGEGYEREVGEQGGRLSGGQQQRLCIARALVEQPDLLILDEPTSSLDVRSEHLIRATLLEMKDRMSVVIIAHRLSTLDICDRIMVIQDGRIMGFDTPGALEQSNDFYREALTLSGLR